MLTSSSQKLENKDSVCLSNKPLSSIDDLKEFKIPSSLQAPLDNLLKTWLPNANLKIKSHAFPMTYEIGDDGTILEFSEEKVGYDFFIYKKEDKLIALPKLAILHANWNLNLKEILPQSIIDIYTSIGIKFIRLHIEGNSSYFYSKFLINKIAIFGINIDSLEIGLKTEFLSDHAKIFLGMKIKYHGLTLEGILFDKNLVLKGECEKPTETLDNFIKEFAGVELPEWLITKTQIISKITGEISPFDKVFSFEIHINDIDIFSLDEKFSVVLKGIHCKIDNSSDQTHKINISISGQLIIGPCAADFSWSNNETASNYARGKIKNENINQLIGYFIKEINIKDFKPEFKSDLNYTLSENKMEIFTENFSIQASKADDSKWHYTVEYQENIGNLSEIIKLLPDFIQPIISQIKVKLYYSTKAKLFSGAIKIPLHEIKEIKSILGDNQFYLPLEITKKEKWELIVGDIKLPQEINFLGLTLKNSKFNFNHSALNFNSELHLGLTKALKGCLAIGKNSIAGSFDLGVKIAILGVIIKKLSAKIKSDPALSISTEAEFRIEETELKDSKSGKLEVGITAGSIKSFKMYLEFALCLENLFKILINAKDRQKWNTVMEFLNKLLPFYIGPIKDPETINSINQSNYDELKNLLGSTNNQLICCVDLLEPSLKVAGEVNLADIFHGFIMVDMNLRSGLILIASIKPIDLFFGKIKIRKSNYISPDHKPPIELDAPVMYLRVPGWECLFNSNELNKFCFHGDACIDFFGLQCDASVDLNSQGFDFYLKTQFECPVFVSSGLIHVEGKKGRFSFELDTRITVFFSLINLTLLDVACKIAFMYQETESAWGIQASGNFALNILRLIDKNLCFKLTISNKDSQNLSALISAIPRLLSQMNLTDLDKPEYRDHTFMDSKSDSNLINNFRNQYFDLKMDDRFRERNIKLCLFRYLLRVNNPAEIIQAFKIINEIEGISESEITLEDPNKLLNFAISKLENKPLLTFCYLRFLESHLLIKSSLTEDESICRGLLKYYLGVMYAYKNVPMSKKIHEEMDQVVEDKNLKLTYLSSAELFRQAINYFNSSYEDFCRFGNNSLLYFLPLYQLWHFKDSIQSDQIEIFSHNIKSIIFKKENEDNEPFLVYAYPKILEKISPKKNRHEEIKISFIILIECFLKAINPIDFKINKEKITLKSKISTIDDNTRDSLIINILLEEKFLDKNILLYQAILKFYMNINDISQNDKFITDVDALVIKIKEGHFDPLLHEDYGYVLISNFYYKKAKFLLKQTPKDKISIQAEYKTLFDTALKCPIRERPIAHYSSTESILKEVYYPQEIMAHKYLHLIYLNNSFHDNCKEHKVMDQCQTCLSEANKQGIKYLKATYFTENRFKLNGQIIKPNDLNLIDFNTFLSRCNQKRLGGKLPSTFMKGMNTIRLLDEAQITLMEYSTIAKHEETRVLLAFQSCIFRIEICKFYMVAIRFNYLPAFFKLEKFLENFEITLNYNSALFKNLFDLLSNDKSGVENKDPIQKLMNLSEALENKGNRFFSSQFAKTRNNFFSGEITLNNLISPLRDELPSLTSDLDKISEIFSDFIKDLSKDITKTYEKMSESQKQEFHQIKSQSTIFRNDNKPTQKYLFWTEQPIVKVSGNRENREQTTQLRLQNLNKKGQNLESKSLVS